MALTASTRALLGGLEEASPPVSGVGASAEVAAHHKPIDQHRGGRGTDPEAAHQLDGTEGLGGTQDEGEGVGVGQPEVPGHGVPGLVGRP